MGKPQVGQFTTAAAAAPGLFTGGADLAGTIGLQAGTPAFAVTYFQSGGGQSLAVSYQSPDVAKQLIPAASLRYLPGSAAWPQKPPLCKRIDNRPAFFAGRDLKNT